ncbi:MmcQ/YjbR family DNA-binding protein [Alkalimarinus sediminis]|uniref:MmcQ/YjbR family DNA-binding protein n=1 Tax=Alkalimarinus sediminis TaxID=1632866 RepID=A0A9E8HPT6_9ALTE|nr:MmcQ/YjbR family DNA-binding protein [Alkalimarinus sediminis]UZW76876.1 MmcQ/YjbR family DNA-binding protein [Alkalimarinus sediminis]
MDYEIAKLYLLSKPETEESEPFGEGIPVFKVKNKIFAILGMNNGVGQLNLKCDPEEALALRDIFTAVIPGYHMNKKHWNTVILDGTIPNGEIERMIDHSYTLIVKGLKKIEREGLELRYGQDALYKK